MNRTSVLLAGWLAALALGSSGAADPPGTYRHKVLGLFSKDRERVFREALRKIPEIELVSLDFDDAEAVLRYSPANLASKGTPEEIVRVLNQKVQSITVATLGIGAARTGPPAKFARFEIPVAGIDCEACCFGAYRAIAQVEGVEAATVSFHDGRAIVRMDPAKADRAKVEAALKKLGVEVKASDIASPSPPAR